MDVIAAFFARVLRMCLSRPCTGFLPIWQEVRATDKTRNQLRIAWDVTTQSGGICLIPVRFERVAQTGSAQVVCSWLVPFV